MSRFRPGLKIRKRRRYNRAARTLRAKIKKVSRVVNHMRPTHKVYQLSWLPYVSYSGNYDVAAKGAIQLFAPQTGTGFQNRQGPTVHLNKIELQGQLVSTNTSECIRIVVFSMREDFETGVDVNSLFNFSAGTTGAPCSPFQPSVLCNQQYKILWDSGPRVMGTAGGNLPTISFRKTINMKGKMIDFGSATTGNPAQNGVYCVVWGSQAPGVGPTYITNTVAVMRAQCHFTG